MIEFHRSNGRQVTAYVFSEPARVAQGSERRLIASKGQSAPRLNRANYSIWEIVAFWGFVVFNIAALVFCAYIIFAKCSSGWPF